MDFEIKIVDQGCGIKHENLEKLFLNFSRLEEHREMSRCGTGLGLSICKSLIEMMGGSVKVESELGEGTSFIISLKTKCQVKYKEEFMLHHTLQINKQNNKETGQSEIQSNQCRFKEQEEEKYSINPNHFPAFMSPLYNIN